MWVAVAGVASERSEAPVFASAGFASACGLAACPCAVVAAVCVAFALPASWPILETSLSRCAVATALNEGFGVPWSTAATKPPLVLASVAVPSVVPVAASPSVVVVSVSTLAPAVLALLSLAVAVSVLPPAICAAVEALAAMPAAAIVSGEAAASPAWLAAAFGSTGTTGGATRMAFGSGTATCVASGCTAASTVAATVPSVLSPLVPSDFSDDFASEVSDLSLVGLAGSAVASFAVGADVSVSSFALLCEGWSVAAVSRGPLSGADDDSVRRGAVSCGGALLLIAWVLLSTSEPKESLLHVSLELCDRAGFCCALWTCTLAATSDARPTTENLLETSSA
ncbi:hypothetical protein ACVWXN_010507 [Bradyrhizobium sp. i1.4.4]